jgi:hypothetical protein
VPLLTEVVHELFSNEAAAANDHNFHFLIHMLPLFAFCVDSEGRVQRVLISIVGFIFVAIALQ